MAEAERNNGQRLIDVLDIHYYPEAKGQDIVTECTDYTHTDCIEARLQSPRTLYDGTYIENNWIGNYNQQYMPIIPNIQNSTDTCYPNTKLSSTEYNFGGENHISGAVAEADTLGVFASAELPAPSVIQIELTADDNYVIMGNVNTDGIVDKTDLQLLNNLLLAIPNTNLSWKNADLTNDEVIGAFDLCKLRCLIADWNTPIKEPEYIAFWKTKSG